MVKQTGLQFQTFYMYRDCLTSLYLLDTLRVDCIAIVEESPIYYGAETLTNAWERRSLSLTPVAFIWDGLAIQTAARVCQSYCAQPSWYRRMYTCGLNWCFQQ